MAAIIVPVTSATRELFVDLFLQYAQELSQYSERLKQNPFTRYDIISFLSHPVLSCQLIYSDDVCVGFIMTMMLNNVVKNAPKVFYIEEFYILPEYRRKGIGLSVVRTVTHKVKVPIMLHILCRNSAARAFWSAVSKELGWQQTTVTGEDLPDCTAYMFLPPGKH